MSRGCGPFSRGEFASECDGRGLSIEVYPGRDFLTLELWCLPEDLEWGVGTLVQMVWETTLETREVQVAREEHLQQLAARKDEKRSRLNDEVRARLYRKEHPFSRPLLGTVDGLSRAESPTLKRFQEEILSGVSGVVCATGAFQEETLLTVLEKVTSGLSFRPYERPHESVSPFYDLNQKSSLIPFPTEQTEVMMALPAVSRWHNDYRLASFCNEILGGAFLSRLTRAVRMGQGLAYSAESRLRSGVQGGVVWVGFQTDRGNVIRNCMESLRDEGVGDKEFAHFQEFVRGSLPFDYDSLSSLTSRRLEQILYGEPWALEARQEEFEEKISHQAVQDYLQNMLDPAGTLVCLLGDHLEEHHRVAFHELSEEAVIEVPPLALFESPQARGPEREPVLLHSHPTGSLYGWQNGVRFLSLPRAEVGSISVQVWTLTGSMDEEPLGAGMSHLLEHLMFRGTPSYPDGSFDAILAQRGGLNNAFTTEDFTVYTDYVTEPGLEDALCLEADRFAHLHIDEELFHTELSVVLEERSLRVDCHPLGKAYERIQKRAFGDHPYGHPVIGWKEQLAALSREELVAHYQKARDPSRLLVVLAGGFDEGSALSLLGRTFGNLPPLAEAKFNWPILCPTGRIAPLSADFSRLEERSGYSYLLLCYRFPREGHPDFEACELLARIIGEGDSCRLHEKYVNEEQSFHEVWVNYESQTRDHTLLHIGLATPNNFKGENQAREVGDFLANLKDSLEQKELEKAKRLWKAERAYDTDELEDWAIEVAGRVVLLPWEEVWGQDERVAQVTLGELRSAAERYLSPEGMVAVQLQGQTS